MNQLKKFDYLFNILFMFILYKYFIFIENTLHKKIVINKSSFIKNGYVNEDNLKRIRRRRRSKKLIKKEQRLTCFLASDWQFVGTYLKTIFRLLAHFTRKFNSSQKCFTLTRDFYKYPFKDGPVFEKRQIERNIINS